MSSSLPAPAIGQRWRRCDDEIVTVTSVHQFEFYAGGYSYSNYPDHGLYVAPGIPREYRLSNLVVDVIKPTERHSIKELYPSWSLLDGTLQCVALRTDGTAWVYNAEKDQWCPLAEIPS
jgi:hypothetical protein